MGIFMSCCRSSAADVPTPDAEGRRRQLAEAAERRQQASDSRGIKDIDKVKRQQRKAEEMEKRQEEAARLESDAPVLKWQTH